MRPLATIAVLLFASVFAHAQAAKPCEELKDEIAKKVEANNVKSYSLEIVAKDKEVEGKVVGTCEGGTKKIVYRKTSTPAQTPAPEASKP
ncbi:MAG TPA: DUF1161 domain-containing protein [Terriglobales bacterium]|nr:DUF1161 domain-containing protein [Terriglobales bacterium]